jgi:hypothetical protein
MIPTKLVQTAFPTIQPQAGISGSIAPDGVVQNALVSGVNVLLFIAGAAALIYLIISGIKYITSGGDAKKAASARAAILNTMIGIVIIVSSFFIIRVATSVGREVTNLGTRAINP